MKTFLFLLAVLLGGSCLYSQVGEVSFADNTTGYVVNLQKTRVHVGDSIMLESLDNKLWQPAKGQDSTLYTKKGRIEKILKYKSDMQYAFAKIEFVVDGKRDMVDDWMILLFEVGDTIQVFKTVDDYDEDIYKVYLGQLPGTPNHEPLTAVIRKIKY